MIPGNARIVNCPYCGKEKRLMTLISGNNLGARYWSDNKEEAPMLPRVSPMQKCDGCGKYYLEYKQGFLESRDHTSERGELTYPEWKEAYMQFTNEQCDDVSDDDLTKIRFWLIQAYNDYYHRSRWEKRPESPEEHAFIANIIIDFIAAFNWQTVKSPLLKAELYREANEMEKCAATLHAIDFDHLSESGKQLFRSIQLRMENKDTTVFELKF
jgi:hypothetical protein